MTSTGRGCRAPECDMCAPGTVQRVDLERRCESRYSPGYHSSKMRVEPQAQEPVGHCLVLLLQGTAEWSRYSLHSVKWRWWWWQLIQQAVALL